MAGNSTNIQWKPFETKQGLDKDPEYISLAQRAYFVITNTTYSLNCTEFCRVYLTSYKVGKGDLVPGRMMIGPDPKHRNSYTHEAVGIANLSTNEIIAVFDPVRNAIGGQKNSSPGCANDRYSLAQWLHYKTRAHHAFPFCNDVSRPFCVFAFNPTYLKRGYTKVVKQRANHKGVTSGAPE